MHTAPGAEDYRSLPDLIRLPLGETQALLYSPLSRSARVVSALGLRLLQGCATFAPLDGHAARLCRELNLPPPRYEAVRRELGELAAAGLLVSRGQLLAAAAGDGRADEPPARIAAVGIPTRDRPGDLSACLTGYLEAAREHGRDAEFVVIDDSAAAGCDENRCLLDALVDRFRAAIFHAGPGDKARFADALARQAGVPPALVRFALGVEDGWPITTGGSRNALLLHTAGDLLLQADDDTRCAALPAPERRPGLALSAAFDPTEFWFFAEEGAVPTPHPAERTDLLGLHEQLLGRTVGDCLGGRDGPPDLDATNARFWRRLQAGEGRILTTATGVVGDSGMGSPVAPLTLDGASRARLHRAEAGYRDALTHRQCMRAVTRPTIADGGYCMALNLGLDNRQLLPPFLPFQRNQDGVFGAVLALCGGGYTGFLPWMVPHHCPAVPPAPAPEERWRRAARLQTGHLVQTLFGSAPQGPAAGDPAARLRALGAWLEDVASARPDDFAEYVRLHALNSLARTASQLEAQLRKHGGQPACWADDVRRLLSALAEVLAAPEAGLPADLCPSFGTEPARERLQGLVRRFGALLRAWPDLVTAAKALRARGVRPARRCGTAAFVS